MPLDIITYNKLQKAIKDGNNLAGWTEESEQLNGKITEVDTRLTSELAQKANKEEVNSLATDKADKTYVDQQIANTVDGKPKGVYATLSALQTAFPTGTTGIHLVTADGKWYYWNGSAWTAGGVYQAAGLDDSLKNVVRDSIPYKLTNMVKNGNFANGTTSWVVAGATVVSTANNEIQLTTSALNNRMYQDLVYNSGDVIYRAVQVKATSNQVGLGTSATLLQAHSGSGQYELLSNVSTTGEKWISVVDKRTANWDTIYAKNFIAMNLTQLFGAGKEPSKTDIDKFLTAYPNQWFDATVSRADGNIHFMDKDVAKIKETIYSKTGSIQNWFMGGIESGGVENALTIRARSEMVKVDKGTTVKATTSDAEVILNYYSLESKTWVGGSSDWADSVVVPYDCYIKVMLRYSDNRVITDVDMLGSYCTVTKTKLYDPLPEDYQERARKVLHKIPGTEGQSIFFVGNEMWAILASSNDRLTYGTCLRYMLDLENETYTTLGSFTHDWGHVALVEYCEETDSIIVGAGTSLSTSASVGGELEFYVFPNTSSFKTLSHVSYTTHAVKYDISELGWGRQVFAMWGEDNNRNYNICYVGTNDGVGGDESTKDKSNLFIRKVLLGRGSTQLENGTFISGKTATQFNGTFKVLATYKGDMIYSPYEAYQDGAFYNGKIYIGLGHDGVWFEELTMNENGSLTGIKQRERYWYANDGSPIQLVTQAMTIKDDLLYMRVYEYGTNSTSLNVYKL